jgi:hypothetical protein
MVLIVIRCFRGSSIALITSLLPDKQAADHPLESLPGLGSAVNLSRYYPPMTLPGFAK